MGILSRDPFQFIDSCRHIIGKSGGFCIVNDCRINHQGTTPENLKVGTCYVVKNPRKTGFLHPIIDSEWVSQDLLVQMTTWSLTLNEWNEKVDRIKYAYGFRLDDLGNNIAVDLSDLHSQEKDEMAAVTFKTPKKEKQDSKGGIGGRRKEQAI